MDGFPGSTEALLRQVIETLHRELVDSDRRVLLRILIAEGHRFPEITRLYHDEIVRKGQTLIGRIVEHGIASGEFERNAIQRFPQIIMAPVVMAAIWKMTFEPFQPIATEDFAAAHADLVFRGLLKRVA